MVNLFNVLIEMIQGTLQIRILCLLTISMLLNCSYISISKEKNTIKLHTFYIKIMLIYLSSNLYNHIIKSTYPLTMKQIFNMLYFKNIICSYLLKFGVNLK